MKELIRIVNTDIPGKKPIYPGLTKIYGVSFSFSHAICNHLNIPKTKKIGELTEQQLQEVEQLIKNPSPFPAFLYNRRKDVETGQNVHLIGTELRLRKEFDIRHLKKIKCYRGVRHSLGLPVRGQRTRGNFRTGATVGVIKKAAKIAAAKAGTTPEPKKK